MTARTFIAAGWIGFLWGTGSEAAEVEKILGLCHPDPPFPREGSYFTGDDRVLKLKGDFSVWTKANIQDVWIDEYYGNGPLSRKEAEALSQYPLVRGLTFGRPMEVMNLSGEALREFQKCPQLEDLTLNLSRLGPDTLAALEGFQRLQCLSIFVTGFDYVSGEVTALSVPTDEWAAVLAKLEKLTWLSLRPDSRQTMSNRFLEEIRRLKHLRYLSVKSANFDDRSFELAGSLNLDELSIDVPKLKGMTFKGLEKSGIRTLGVGDLSSHSTVRLRDFSKEAWEVFLEMPDLEEFRPFNFEMQSGVEGLENAAELLQIREKLGRRLKENKARNAEADRKAEDEKKPAGGERK